MIKRGRRSQSFGWLQWLQFYRNMILRVHGWKKSGLKRPHQLLKNPYTKDFFVFIIDASGVLEVAFFCRKKDDMAKLISDEIMRLRIDINGDESQVAITRLNQKTSSLKETISELRAEEKLLLKNRLENRARLGEITGLISKHTASIRENKLEIEGLVRGMNHMDLTMGQLRQRITLLRGDLSNMNPNSEGFRKGQEELGLLNTRLRELQAGSDAGRRSLADLSETIDRYSGLATVVIGVVGAVGLTVSRLINSSNKLADAQTAVAKTTGLSNEEVKNLTRSFSEFDTRTKRLDLLKISEIGGRLGVSKNEIKDFTREIDKAYVALGDAFSGGVEKVAEKLGKIKGLFKETKDLDMATAIGQIGSALNELGANGAASEENISEFALRVGALPEKLKPTVSEAMALGAAFEESGIDAERAGTAYSSFVRTAAKESQAFAEVMGITKQQVEDLINQDPLEFFLKFSEGAKGLDAVEMANMLDHLKLNDQYVVSILGSASENVDKFRKSIELSNQALKDASSLQEEFDKVNNNAAAIYDKVSKAFAGMFTSEAVIKTLNWLIEVMGRLLGVIEENGERASTFTAIVVTLGRVLIVLGAGIVSAGVALGVYNTLLKESIVRTTALEMIEKARMLTGKLMLSFQYLWNMAIATGQRFLASYGGTLITVKTATELQTAAQLRANAVMGASPIGAIVTLLGLAVSAYMTYSSMVDETSVKVKSLNELTSEAIDTKSSEISKLEQLYKAAVDESKGKDAQREAIERLQRLYPSYFGHMSEEDIRVGKLKTKYLELKEAIIASAKARAIEKEVERLTGEQLKLREKAIDGVSRERKIQRENQGSEDYGADDGVGISFRTGDAVNESKARQQKILNDYKEANGALASKINDLTNMLIPLNKKSADYEKDVAERSAFSSNYKTDFPKDKKEGKGRKSDAEKQAEREAERLKRAKEKLLEEMVHWYEKEQDIEIRYQEYSLAKLQEGYDKEFDMLLVEQEKKVAALEKEKYSQEEFDVLDKMIGSEKTQEGRAKFEKIKAQWSAYNDDLTRFQVEEMELTAMKLRILKEKNDMKEFQAREKAYERKISLKKTEEQEQIASLESVEQQKEFLRDKISQEELGKIRTWEEGKKAIQAYYNKESLELHKKHLEALVKELEALPSASLTEEQSKALDELRGKLAGVKAELTEIRVNKNGDGGANFSSLSSFGGSGDIFGLSQEQWEAMFANTDKIEEKIQKVGAAVRVAQTMMSSYYNFVKANQEQELRRHEVMHDRKRKSLEAQLAAGIISQQEYKHAMISNENELAMKRYQLELDAAKREKAMKIADTIANTAMAIMSIWSKQGANPITAGILTGLVTAMGAVQVATIASQPLPTPPSVVGAEEGYYPVFRKQDGKLFHARRRESRSGLYDEPTMLVGEQGKNFPELVVSGRAMKRIDSKIQQDFMQEVARVEGFERGFYPNVERREDDGMMLKMMSLIERNIAVIERLEERGVRGVFEKNARTGKDLEEMQKEYRRILEKNKH